MKLKDKIALVTGGSKGIGKAIAKAYAREGTSVIICARNEVDLKKTEEEIERETGREVHCFALDVSNKEEVDRLSNKIEKKWGKLHILVNNASILGSRVTISEYPEEEWEEVIRINLTGPFFMIKALTPLIIKAGGGSIINLSSTVGRVGRPLWGAYAVSKFGLEGLTQILAGELRDYNIRVNSVNPGGTRTEMRREAYPEEDPMTLPTPDDIVGVFLYLASDESKDVTGKALDARDWMKRK